MLAQLIGKNRLENFRTSIALLERKEKNWYSETLLEMWPRCFRC